MLARAIGRPSSRSASSISIAERAHAWVSSSSSSAWRAAPVWCLVWARVRCACSAQLSVSFLAMGLSLSLGSPDHGQQPSRPDVAQVAGGQEREEVDAGGDSDDRGAWRKLWDQVAEGQPD